MCGRFTQYYTWAEVQEFMSVFGTPRNLPRRAGFARRPRGLLGPAAANRLSVRRFGGSEGLVRSLPDAPWRGRTGRFRLPAGRDVDGGQSGFHEVTVAVFV